MTELEMEKTKLDDTLAIVQTVLSEEKDALDKLYKEFIGDREELWRMADIKNMHIRNLEASLDKPYFARIDFTYNDEDKVHTIYIGKNGISQDAKIVVTDWRAPISSLYYDAEIGKCSFMAPEGTITGNMSLKRQYEIENGELLEYFDVDLVSNDALLQKYLNTNNDARLKSIVATIQKEQNEVIRKPLSDDLIVQGVAGSGKTTVALHRIAYLVYNHMQNIQQNQYLVIGPNSVFLKYIKSVLPELDVSGVSQYTFEQFAKDYIDEEIQINSSDQKVNASIAGKTNHDIDKFKCSLKYKNMIDQFLMIYFRSLTNNDLMIGDFKVLDSKSIQNVFATTDKEVYTSLASRIEMTIDLLCRYIEDHNEEIISKYDSYAYELFKTATTEQQKNELRKKFLKEKEEIKKNARNSLRKYFAKGRVDATKLYKMFVSTINEFDIYNYAHLNTLKKETLANLKKNTCDFEDLPALIHIKRKLCHNKRYNQIRHVVVDEAQDLGEFNFMALRDSLPSATFSIFGDLAQSIYDYRGIDNWQEVNDVMFENEGSIINFNKSYRTTAEIMSVADDISESIGLGKSDLVVRHGDPVTFTKCDSEDEIAISIADKIIEYKEKGYKNIAVISKTDLLSRYINDELLARGVEVPNVSATDDLSDDKFRACTISNQLAKGLEFDAVIINNASEDIYSSSSTLDMKLLYVAVTRALHELDVVYKGELVKPLQKALRMDAKKM